MPFRRPGASGYQYRDVTLGSGDHTASDLVARLNLPNLSYITNNHDALGRLLSTVLLNPQLSTLNSHQYTYNDGSQRTRQTFTDNNYADYSYDNIGQLTNADSTLSGEDRSYAYDAAWNLTNRSGSTFIVDTKNELTNAPGPINTLLYDSNGNLVNVGNNRNTFWYDDENRLVQWEYATHAGGSIPVSLTQLAYDGLGRLRIRLEYHYENNQGERPSPAEPDSPSPPGDGWVLDSETDYIYDGMRVIQERDGSNTPLVSYTRGNDMSGALEGAGGIGGLLARSDGYSGGTWTTHNFYHADGNGNITCLANSGQTLAATYKYDPFGNLISSSGSLADANVYRFSSKEQHLNSGMYYYGFRFYDPNLQRWINRDPLEEDGGANLYGYVQNDPINLADPFGLAGNVNLGGGYSCRVDTFNTGDAGGSHEIHVFRGQNEVGVFGPDGWINKHGFKAGPDLPRDVANKLNGVSVDIMRKQGMIPRKGLADIRGLRGRMGSTNPGALGMGGLLGLFLSVADALQPLWDRWFDHHFGHMPPANDASTPQLKNKDPNQCGV